MTKKTLTLALILVFSASCALFGNRYHDNRRNDHKDPRKLHRNLPGRPQQTRYNQHQRHSYRKQHPRHHVKHNPNRNKYQYNRYNR